VSAVITESDLTELRMKILPPGGEQVVSLLNRYRDRVTVTSVTLENVPLVILGRHGMIARLPVDGGMQKLSEPAAMIKGLQAFLAGSSGLYLYANLPDLCVPPFVDDLIDEVARRAALRTKLGEQIDAALDARDAALFATLVNRLRQLDRELERNLENKE
jgi:hypothetical protein